MSAMKMSCAVTSSSKERRALIDSVEMAVDKVFKVVENEPHKMASDGGFLHVLPISAWVSCRS